MFLKFLKKTWWIYVLLIGGYFVLARYTQILPKSMNIFKFNEPEIMESPVLIKEIKEIGELITAEYYGEVYADLFESLQDVIEQYDTVYPGTRDSLEQIYPHLKDYYTHLKKNKDQKERIKTNLNAIDSINAEIKITLLIAKQELKIEIDSAETKYERSKENKTRMRKKHGWLSDEFKMAKEQLEIAGKMLKNAKNKFRENKDKLQEAQQNIKQLQREIKKQERYLEKYQTELNKYRKRNNLVYIGRGWVKAGFNLKKLQTGKKNSDIYIDEEDSLKVYVHVAPPEIIDSVINPWFIPEKEIQGYEIFIEAGKEYSHHEVTKVKMQCVKNLVDVAIEKGLFDLATKSGKNTLEHFFRLLGFQEVNIIIKGNDEMNNVGNLTTENDDEDIGTETSENNESEQDTL